jgi:hypothetical protein
MALNAKLRTPGGLVVPKLMFGQHLARTLFEFDAYQWNPKKPNSPKDENDHMMENLYRMVLQGLHYVKPEKQNKHVALPTFGTMPRWKSAAERKFFK